MTRPRVLAVADVHGWAWDRKARQYALHLCDAFDIGVHFQVDDGPIPAGYDLYHTFALPQTDHLDHIPGARCVTGVTAHVLATWGEFHVRRWAAKAVALHGNSLLLVEDLRPFHNRVFYTPNGVDADFWRPTRIPALTDRFAVGHVGKPNPRKGFEIIREACARANVEFRAIQRRASDALPPEAIRDFYQDLDVYAVASDFDGTPNPALEAACCGIAIVSNRIGNMPEFLRDGENGLLVERDVESLAAALGKLAADRERTIRMGRAARETAVAQWTWALQVEHVRAMWREVLAP